uniref:Ig-like domain-containing protein n=1 Tax=Pundamilia nyererei TaxID=303518 RepID=A0A3B4H2B1_9CICH
HVQTCDAIFSHMFHSLSSPNITAESGQDVTLTCRDPNNNITAVYWRKADLEPKYVLLYWNGHFDPDHQHPSFKNRVDLKDRQMKDGDVSLILKDVTTADSGTYRCHVKIAETNSSKYITINLSINGFFTLHLTLVSHLQVDQEDRVDLLD